MWWGEVENGLLLRIKAQPGAQKDEVAGVRSDELLLRVNAQPEEGKANKAIIAFLSKRLKIAKGEIVLKSGESARHKTLLLPDCTKVRQWLHDLETIYSKESL